MKTKSIILVCLVFFLLNYTYAQQAGKTYYIQSAIGKHLDVQWANTANNTPLHLWPFNGGNAQKFTLENAGGGYFYIKSALGKYVHVKGGKNTPKSLVTIYSKVNQDNLKWKFENAGGGYYYIESKLGTYLDVQWGSNKNGTPIWMWNFNGGNAQKWKLVSTGGVTSSNNMSDKELLEAKIIKEPKTELYKKGKKRYKETKEETISKDIDDVENSMYCTVEKISFDESPQEKIGYLITGGNSAAIYPGAMFEATAFTEGTEKTIDHIKHKSYNIAIHLASSTARESEETIEADEDGYVSSATIINACSDLMRANENVKAPLRFVFTTKEIKHKNELAIMAYGAFNGFGASVDLSFNLDEKHERRLHISKFWQKYYSITVDSKSIIPEEEKSKVKNDDQYISEVSYGRVGFLRIESKYSSQTINAVLNGKYSGTGYDSAVGGAVDYSDVASEMTITAYGEGGGGDTFGTIQEFDAWKKEAKWDPEVAQVPIGYKLKFLKDNSIADVRQTSEYYRRVCRSYTATRITFLGLGMLGGWHNDDCIRVGYEVRVTMEEVNGDGQTVKEYDGFLNGNGNEKGKNLTISEWKDYERVDRNNGCKGTCYVYPKRHGKILTHNKIIEGKLEAKNLNNVPKPYIDFKVDQKAFDADKIQVRITSIVKSCHKSNGMAGDWFCGNYTKNHDKGGWTKTLYLKSLLGGKGEIDFGTKVLPMDFERGDSPHLWEPYFNVKNY